MHMEQGEHGLSTSWSEHLEERHGLGPESVLEDNLRYTLVGEIGVESACALGMNVYHAPNGDTPLDCAHALVDWPTDQITPGSDRPPRNVRRQIKNDLARLFDFVFGEVTTTPPIAND
jgi:hypothetical protein